MPGDRTAPPSLPRARSLRLPLGSGGRPLAGAGAGTAGVGTLALARDPQPLVHRARQGPPRGGDRDHWGAARVDRLDDLGVVDALQIDRGDPDVAVPKLALDDDERDAFAGHLD